MRLLRTRITRNDPIKKQRLSNGAGKRGGNDRSFANAWFTQDDIHSVLEIPACFNIRWRRSVPISLR